MVSETERRYEQRFAGVEREIREGLEAVRRETNKAFDASEKAIRKAEVSVNERLALLNELRGVVDKLIGGYMTRGETEQRLSVLSDKIDALKTTSDVTVGHSGGIQSGWGILVSAVLAVAAVVTVIITVKG